VEGRGDPAAVDFAPVPDFEIVIAAGTAAGTGTFVLDPEADAVVESDETLTVSGTSDLPVTPAVVTLSDDDEASTRIVLSAVPARVSEGAGPTPVAVTATLDQGLRQTATAVTVSVAGGGDPDTVDFDPVGDFRITIPANAASGSGTFVLRPEDDRNVESDDTLAVSGVSDLPVTSASVALADDDEVSTRILLFLTVNPAQASEGGGPVEVTVAAAVDKGVRPSPTRVAVTVTASGDPLAVDFAPVPDFEIVIPANAPEGTATFTVTPEDDMIVERDEVVTVAGTSDLPVTKAVLLLLDDDEAGGILLAALPVRVTEGGGPVAVEVTASLAGSVRQHATTVTVSVSGSGDPTAVDFNPVADFAIVIAARSASGSGTFMLTPEDDREDESDESLTISGASDLPVTPTSVSIIDDDESAPPALSVADASVAEGAAELAFVVDLDAPSSEEVTVRYGSADATAEAGSDYEPVSGTLAFAPGEVSKTVRVVVLDDELDEPDETLTLGLSHPRNATLARASASGTILDDDDPPVLSIAGASGMEGDGQLDFVISLSAPSIAEVTVRYATRDGTAAAGSDYRPVDGTMTFAPGQVAMTASVAVIDDTLDEVDEETFAVALSANTGASLDRAADRATATGVIVDDDDPPEVTVDDAAGDETVGSLAFVVSLGGPSAVDVAVDYATADDTATAGRDYEARSGTLSFAPGTVARTILVPVLDDAEDEPDETFVVTLSDPRNATLADGSATGTIRDDDLSAPDLAGGFPNAALCVGGAPFELDLAGHFEGEQITFSVVSSAPGVATAVIAGTQLTVLPVAEGTAMVTVTASNPAGTSSGEVAVRVVADPAELAAVDAVLASIGRGVLSSVTASVGDRFAQRSASATPSSRAQPEAFAVVPGRPLEFSVPGPAGWNTWAPGMSTDDIGWSGGLAGPPGRPEWIPRRSLPPFSFSLDGHGRGADSDNTGWSVWARGDEHRFESGVPGTSHEGAMTSIHLGADYGTDDWLGGVSVLHGRSEADYRFDRSMDACGAGGTGEGIVDTELTSIHPYGGRHIGRGSVWATVGAGDGELSVKRCDPVQTDRADLSLRMAAAGGRHPFANRERLELSVVEDVGVVVMTTGAAAGLAGDRSVTVGRARLGLEAAGVAPPGCECSLTTYVRAFARGDWGDGATGAALELAAGLRYRNLARRLGIDAGVQALAIHSTEEAVERSANVGLSILPRADGTGLQAAVSWRREGGASWVDGLGGISPWTVRRAPGPGRGRDGIAETRIAYGIATSRGLVALFAELAVGRRAGAAGRFGLRQEFGDGHGGLLVEWVVETPAGLGETGQVIAVSALGRF
jgi:hypothetical protein